MASYVTGGGNGSAQNLNKSVESAGWDTSTGTAKAIASAAGNNTKGSYDTLINGTANAWAGFILRAYTSSLTAGRFLIDLSTNGTDANLIGDLYAQTSTGGSSKSVDFWIPRQVAQGAHIRARCQCSTGNNSISLGLLGVIASATAQPGFTATTALTTPDNTNTRAVNSNNINLQGTGATSWTTIATTAADYGAILMATSQGSSAPTAAKVARFAIADDSVLVATTGGGMQTSGALLPGVSLTAEHAFASGSAIGGNIQTDAAGAPDGFCMQLYGFS